MLISPEDHRRARARGLEDQDSDFTGLRKAGMPIALLESRWAGQLRRGSEFIGENVSPEAAARMLRDEADLICLRQTESEPMFPATSADLAGFARMVQALLAAGFNLKAIAAFAACHPVFWQVTRLSQVRPVDAAAASDA